MSALHPEVERLVVALSGPVGPRGGNVDNEGTKPAWRRAEYNGGRTESGVLELHRFEDTTSNGNKNEQPWHRMAAMLMLNGTPNKDIAAAANVTIATISQLRAQKWFQQVLADLAAQQAGGLVGLVKGEAVASIQTIVNLRDDPDAPARVRLSAAQDLVDRAEGKAIQRVIAQSHVTHYSSPEDEMKAIREELASLEAKTKN